MDKKVSQASKILPYIHDFHKFCYYVMGYHDMNAEHRALCSFMSAGKKSKLILMPRYSFKSCICTVAYALWKLISNPNLRILIYSDSAMKAQGFLLGIKNQVLGQAANTSFRGLFGEWETDPHKGKWNESQIIIKQRTEHHSEPTVDTAGIGTTKVGCHYDIVIFDDIVSDVNTTTKDLMDNTASCYQKSLSLLKPGGETIMVGCLVAGTEVTMADGTHKAIEKILPGEKVIAYKYDREHSAETVEAMIPQGVAHVYELKTPNETIQATSNHPFLTKDGFKKLEDLKVGDKIYALSYLPRILKTDLDVAESHHISIGNKKRIKRFRLQTITSIDHIGEKEVFDLTVSNEHNFIAEGLVVHNTRWDFGDLYGRIIDENRDTEEFDIHRRNAEYVNDEGKLLFESIGLDKEFLNKQKSKQGSYMFSCLYNNTPVDPETATFKVADFKFYGELEKSQYPRATGLYKDLYITCTVDPAGEGEDYTGITVVGTDSSLKMYVIDIVNKHLQVNEIVDNLFRLNDKYHFKRVGIESTFYRGMLIREIDIRKQEEQKKTIFHNFGVEEFKTRWRKGEGKHQRILSMQPFHERGDLLFPGKSFERLTGDFRELAYQMIQYPRAPHDDIVDSLSWHVEIINRGGTQKRSGPPKYSAAWLEKEWIQNRNTRMSRISHRYKRPIKSAFS